MHGGEKGKYWESERNRDWKYTFELLEYLGKVIKLFDGYIHRFIWLFEILGIWWLEYLFYYQLDNNLYRIFIGEIIW